MEPFKQITESSDRQEERRPNSVVHYGNHVGNVGQVDSTLDEEGNGVNEATSTVYSTPTGEFSPNIQDSSDVIVPVISMTKVADAMSSNNQTNQRDECGKLMKDEVSIPEVSDEQAKSSTELALNGNGTAIDDNQNSPNVYENETPKAEDATSNQENPQNELTKALHDSEDIKTEEPNALNGTEHKKTDDESTEKRNKEESSEKTVETNDTDNANRVQEDQDPINKNNICPSANEAAAATSEIPLESDQLLHHYHREAAVVSFENVNSIGLQSFVYTEDKGTSMRKKSTMRNISENKILSRLILGRKAFLAATKKRRGNVAVKSITDISIPETLCHIDDESIDTEEVASEASREAFEVEKLSASAFENQFVGIPKAEFTAIDTSFLREPYPDGPVVSRKTYNKTDWFRCYETLNIYRYPFPITERHVEASAESLTVLRVHSLISFRSLYAILRTCTRLEKLKFTNIVVVNKNYLEQMPQQPSPLPLPQLDCLEFLEVNRRFTKYDYWLLDFFCNFVETPALSSFTFRASDFFSQDPRMKITKVEVTKRDPSVLLKFLVKNHKSIETLSIAGLGLQLYEYQKSAACFPELDLVQPKSLSLSLNIRCIEDLLVHQNSLRELVVFGYTNHFDEVLRVALAVAIQESHRTIETIDLQPILITKMNRKHHVKVYSWSCEVFRNCVSLKHLKIDVKMATRVDSNEKICCCNVRRLCNLPVSLETLELHVERLPGDELDVFFNGIYKYARLREVILASSPSNAYLLHLRWIRHLIELPNLGKAEFFGAKLSDFGSVCQLLRSKPTGFVTMTLLNDRISFHKMMPAVSSK